MELPIELIQHIQSFLDEKEAVRTSLLSKSWHHACFTRPILVFQILQPTTTTTYQTSSSSSSNYGIWEPVLATMKRYKESDLKLDKLALRINHHYDNKHANYFNHLIADASTLGLTQLDLWLDSEKHCFHSQTYDPLPVFGITSLTKLSLRVGRQVKHRGRRVLCSRLVSLRLEGFKSIIEEDFLRGIFTACPLIENLALINLGVYLHVGDEEESTTNRVLCPRLRSLSLDSNVYVFPNTFYSNESRLIFDILSGSPLLENLDYCGGSGMFYHLDPVLSSHVFTSRSLRRLSVRQCTIQMDDGPLRCSCSGLLSLSFASVTITDDVIQDILLASPLIQNLDLDGCKEISTINLPNLHNLVTLRIQNCCPAEVFFGSEYYRLCSVSLMGVTVKNGFFTTFSTRFPCVEHLSLINCNGFASIQVSSCSLKYLELINHQNKLHKAEFDLPNIRKFVFDKGDGHIPSLSFRTRSSEWESQVKLSFSVPDIAESSWFVKLRKFLKELSLSRISLDVDLGTNTLGWEKWEKYLPCSSIPPVVVENLKVYMKDQPDVLCPLLRCCRPTLLNIIYLHSNGYTCTQLLYELFVLNLFNKMRSLLLLMYDLEEIVVEILGENNESWQSTPLTEFVEDAYPVIRWIHQEQIRFRFKWRAFSCT